jgi:hypothetical protein
MLQHLAGHQDHLAGRMKQVAGAISGRRGVMSLEAMLGYVFAIGVPVWLIGEAILNRHPSRPMTEAPGTSDRVSALPTSASSRAVAVSGGPSSHRAAA